MVTMQATHVFLLHVLIGPYASMSEKNSDRRAKPQNLNNI